MELPSSGETEASNGEIPKKSAETMSHSTGTENIENFQSLPSSAEDKSQSQNEGTPLTDKQPEEELDIPVTPSSNLKIPSVDLSHPTTPTDRQELEAKESQNSVLPSVQGHPEVNPPMEEAAPMVLTTVAENLATVHEIEEGKPVKSQSSLSESPSLLQLDYHNHEGDSEIKPPADKDSVNQVMTIENTVLMPSGGENVVENSNVTVEQHATGQLLQDPNDPNKSSKENEKETNNIEKETNQRELWFQHPYLGGFKHRLTKVEYYNASTQTTTAQELRAKKAKERFDRDTQTKFIRHRFNQTRRESSTQMGKSGCFVTSQNDYVITPKKYVTAAEHHAMIVENVVKLQCFFRKVKARRVLNSLRKIKDFQEKKINEKEALRRQLTEDKHRREVASRIHPKSTKDFEVLYSGLENWRIQETKKVNDCNLPEPARLAALADLLDQESALIQKLDRLKLIANEENERKGIRNMLDKVSLGCHSHHMASSKKWPISLYEGFEFVDTPTTIRARELKDLYHAINLPLLSVDERLQILLHVKYTVKEFDCALSREIVNLIDREGDLVSRGRDGKTLEGLRTRISNLFLQFIETPEFNPESVHFSKINPTQNIWKTDNSVYYCRACTKYIPSTGFYLSTTMKHLGKCKACTMKENIATKRKDDSMYLHLLHMIRIEESRKLGLPQSLSEAVSGEDKKKVADEVKAIEVSADDKAFGKTTAMNVTIVHEKDTRRRAPIFNLLQESDIRYLVDVIWNCQSAISANPHLEQLVLTRWDPMTPLSPWNCILLTKQEAIAHDRQPDPTKLYSEAFVRKIQRKHLAANAHFAQLPGMEKYLKKTYYEEVESGKIKQMAMAGKLAISLEG